ncbi:MAG: Mitochondrial processing peptidase-like protein, partial [uncultured Acetobacteraceae bacterium]
VRRRPRDPPAQRPDRRLRDHAPGRDRVLRRLRRRRHPRRSGGRERRLPLPGAHGLQGHGEARRRRHRPRDRERRRPPQRLHRARADRLLLQGPQGRSAARRRHHRRHPHPLHLRARGTGARARRDPARDRPGQRHAGRHHLRPLPGHRLPEAAHGPPDAGHGGRHRRHAARGAHRLHAPPLRAGAHGGRRRRRAGPRPPARPGADPLRRPAAGRPATAGGRPLRRRRVPRGPRPRPGPHRARLPLRRLRLAAALPVHAAEHAARRRHVLAAVPGDPGAPRSGLLHLLLRPPVPGQRPLRGLRRHRREGGRGTRARHTGRVAPRAARRHGGRTEPRQGAAPRRPADVAGKHRQPRRAARLPVPRPRPRHPRRGNQGQNSRRHHRAGAGSRGQGLPRRADPRRPRPRGQGARPAGHRRGARGM